MKYNRKVFAVITVAGMLLSGCSKSADPMIIYEFDQDAAVIEYAKSTVDPLDLVTVSDANGTFASEKNEKDTSDASRDAEKVSDTLSVTASVESIDASKIGEILVTYTVTSTASGSAFTEEIEECVTVQDTQNPIVELKDKTVSLKTGETFDPESIVTSVSDPIDGDLKKVDKAPTNSKDGWYTITSTVDVSKTGSYKITIHAEDNHGNVTEKIVNVAVSDDGKAEVKADASTEESASTSTNTTASSTAGKTGSSSPTNASSSGSNNGSVGNAAATPSPSGSSGNTGGIPTPTPASGSSGSGSSPTPTPTPAASHTHNWQPVYRTVHHNEVTHEESEQVWVVDQAAYDEPVYGWYDVTICNTCGYSSDSDRQVEDVVYHITWDHDCIGTYHTEETRVQIDTIHHDEVGHYETNTWIVVDQYAYDEQVLDHYECSCGATK